MNSQGHKAERDQNSQERAYRFLKEQIIALELQPGARVSALEIAARLGLSRTPIREALGRLEQEALVAHDPNGGYFVRPMSLKEIDDFYKVREALEVEAAIEALPNLSEAHLAKLGSLLDEAESRCDDVTEFIALSRKFHEAIVDATGNLVLKQFIAPLNDRVRLVGAMLVQVHALRVEEIREENRSILRALMRRDLTATEIAVRAHVRNARECVADLLSQDLTQVYVGAQR